MHKKLHDILTSLKSIVLPIPADGRGWKQHNGAGTVGDGSKCLRE